MATATQIQPIDTIPEAKEDRDKILFLCPRLIVIVAGRCRAHKSEVSRVWNRILGVSRYTRPRTHGIKRALINEVNRQLAKRQTASV